MGRGTRRAETLDKPHPRLPILNPPPAAAQKATAMDSLSDRDIPSEDTPDLTPAEFNITALARVAYAALNDDHTRVGEFTALWLGWVALTGLDGPEALDYARECAHAPTDVTATVVPF